MLGSAFSSDRAKRRIQARFWPARPAVLLASSRKATSRVQCCVFSMP